MIATATDTDVIERAKASDDDELDHYFCCDESRAMCGADLTNVTRSDFDDDGPTVCVVCRDLDRTLEACGPTCEAFR